MIHMMDFFNMIHDSIGWKIVGIALIVWAFYTLLRHPDRVLIDSIMHKKVTEYEEEQRQKKAALYETKNGGTQEEFSDLS